MTGGLNMNKSKYRSKKGFTLVELVVVIAILGILAAIAVPVVYNILGHSSETAEKSDASALNMACKDYYAAVVAGSVNSSSPQGSSQSGLPGPNASASQRKAAADNATVINACEFAGLDKIKTQIQSGQNNYGYDSTGTVQQKTASNKLITASTKLSEIM